MLIPDFTPWKAALIVLTWTAGTALVMWLGELITQRGIGNGMSILIFASVVSQHPVPGRQHARAVGRRPSSPIIVVIAIGDDRRDRHRRVGAAAHPGAVRQTGRRPPHVRRPEHLHPVEGQPVGCDPGDLRELAALVPGAASRTSCRGTAPRSSSATTSSARPQITWIYVGAYALLILFFAYFYTAIAFNPQQQADVIRKQGGFIPGIRPGPPTERYLAKVLNRITLPGGLFIMVIAITPFIALKVFDIQGFIFGGTSILITVGVMLETMKQIDSQLMMRNYEGFLS